MSDFGDIINVEQAREVEFGVLINQKCDAGGWQNSDYVGSQTVRAEAVSGMSSKSKVDGSTGTYPL